MADVALFARMWEPTVLSSTPAVAMASGSWHPVTCRYAVTMVPVATWRCSVSLHPDDASLWRHGFKWFWHHVWPILCLRSRAGGVKMTYLFCVRRTQVLAGSRWQNCDMADCRSGVSETDRVGRLIIFCDYVVLVIFMWLSLCRHYCHTDVSLMILF